MLAELLPLKMNGRSPATLIFIILIPKFNYQVGQFPKHDEHIVDQNVTPLFRVTLRHAMLI